MRDRNTGWQHRAIRNPLPVGLKPHTDLVVKDPQVTVPPARNCVRFDSLHVLRHYSDVGFVAAVITEAIEANAVGEMAEQDDVVFQRDVGPSATAASSTTTTATTSATTATCPGTAAPAATATARSSAATTAARETCVASCGLGPRCFA